MSEVNFIIVKPEVSNAGFGAAVVEQFLAVAADILDELDEEEYNSHMQVACLTRYANTCIENGDLLELKRILRFVDEVLPKVDSSLDDALYVSFIEMLHLDGDAPVRKAARELLSPWQLKFYLAVVDFYSKLPNKTKTS